MHSPPGQPSDCVKEEATIFSGSSLTGDLNGTPKEHIDVTSSSTSSQDELTERDEDDQNSGNANTQLVVYDPEVNGTGENEIVPEPIQYHRPSFGRSGPNMPAKLMPSVGAFTVQCAHCYKWRLIPTKEKYEEIREHVLEDPFFCEKAREWRPNISCDDPTDISQDGSRLWAIDKPNIAQPPAGWQRLLRIRGEGSTKFADVYYEAPTGKRLRSMVEVQKYLMEHPEYARAGVTLSQFSFQIPKPLQENYVRKRPARVSASQDNIKALEPSEVNPLSWVGPQNGSDVQVDRPALLPPPRIDGVSRPAKQAKKASTKQVYSSNPMFNQQNINVEEPSQL